MNRKALFFDIDGTILSETTKTIPESAVQALKQASDNGHLLFINTGRCFSCVPPEIRALPNSGYLCGCGTHLIYQDEDLLYHSIPHDRGREIVNLLQECNAGILLEGREDSYVSREPSRFEDLNRTRAYLQTIGLTNRAYIEDEDYDFDKFLILTDEQTDMKRITANLTDMDLIDRTHGVYEVVPKGFSKGSAIDMILKHFDMTKEDAYVFGDSSNDLAMFTYAIHTVALGQHDPVLDPYTEYVTATVEEDGLSKAMAHYGLI